MSYYDTLVKAFSQEVRIPAHEYRDLRNRETLQDFKTAYRVHLATLTDQGTKRILFDSRQATLFAEIDPPDHKMQSLLHTPFRRFYLEFTEPLQIGESEEGFYDRVRSLVYSADVAECAINIPDEEPIHAILDQVTFFLDNGQDLCDRTFHFNRKTGSAITTVRAATTGFDPSNITIHNQTENSWFISGIATEQQDRHVGWWERITLEYASLTSWILAYMMAKSINIVEEPMSRPQKRWHERHNILPRPWHLVKLDPKIIRHAEQADESDRHVSYRFDVIGHLRFQHQHTKDGHKDIIEWVAPHQRGLSHELYIPKTYKVERGKVPARQMKEYWG
jgi:hypothetical protein